MKTVWILIGVVIACGGCLATRSGDSGGAAAFPKGSRTATAGPYRIQTGSDGTNDLLRLTKGDELVYAKTGNKITVYAEGVPIFDYACNSTGTLVAAFMFHIRGGDGQIDFTLLDENADGVLDKKIDYGTRTVYQWKTNQWVK